jgi:hypothetical protein
MDEAGFGLPRWHLAGACHGCDQFRFAAGICESHERKRSYFAVMMATRASGMQNGCDIAIERLAIRIRCEAKCESNAGFSFEHAPFSQVGNNLRGECQAYSSAT